MNTVMWVMIVMTASGSKWSMGPEFTTKEKCETAAVVVQKAVDEQRWGMNIKKPICVRIEK